MKSYLHLNGKTHKIESYKTRDELEYLEYLFIRDDLSYEDSILFLDTFLTNNGIEDVDKLTEIEKIILLLKIREISIGDELKVKYKCVHCGNAMDSSININNIIKLAEIYSKEICGLFNKNDISELRVEDIVDKEYLEELDIDEYDNIQSNISKYIDTYDFTQTCKCSYCSKDNIFNLNNMKLLFSLLSDESFMSLSKLLYILVTQGKLTREDVLNMTPLQRVLEHGLIEEARKQLEEQMKSKSTNYKII